MLAIAPTLRALMQLDDPVFLGVVIRSVLLSVAGFVLLLLGSTWLVQEMVQAGGWLGWAAGIAGGLLVVGLAWWLFVPVALAVTTLFSDRICAAVEARHYPGLPRPQGAPVAVQAWDGAVLGLQVLGFQSVALVLALLLPGIGLVLGWAITGWAIGRGLFVATAMRRMGRNEALALYGRVRGPVLVQGLILSLASTVPFVNLLVPVLGLAALTHVLNMVNGLPRGGLPPGGLPRGLPSLRRP